MVLRGKNTVMYGDVRLGANVLIEDNVVIGHPSAAELQGCLRDLQTYASVEELYHNKSKAPVIIGDNAIIRSGTVIYSGVTIGSHFDCSHHVLIREGCTIGDDVYIKSHTVMMKQVRVGNHCRLAGMIADLTVIGNHVSSFGALTHRHGHNWSHTDLGPILHDWCIVGREATVIGNVHIYEYAIVASNALVNFDVPASSLITGPKGVIRSDKYSVPSDPVRVESGQMSASSPQEH